MSDALPKFRPDAGAMGSVGGANDSAMPEEDLGDSPEERLSSDWAHRGKR